MNLSIITSFIRDQRRARQIVFEKLEVPVDIPALEWAMQFREVQNKYQVCPFADIFRPHGYGLELQMGDLYIDFDYSEQGRADGFDSWRIFTYLMAGDYDNNGSDVHICDRVFDWISTLDRAGRIQRLDNLYYFVDSVAQKGDQQA
jgi:hypothetical protein